MKRHFWLLRATVEAKAPLAIGTGQGDDLRDALFVAGHGGLPYLPGTSIAGVLSTRFRDAVASDAELEAVFGAIGADASASRLLVSAGQVHNAEDQPVPIDADPDDAVLSACALGVTRDHVRRDGFGVADGRGKFDDSAVPVGARFTFELRLEADDEATAAADAATVVPTILASLAELRLGGKSRRGFGRLVVVRAYARRFDLGVANDRADFVALERDLARSGPEQLPGFEDVARQIRPAANDATLRLAVTLQARDHWLVGGGEDLDVAEKTHRRKGRARHALPWSESVIRWSGPAGGQRGELSETPVPVLPGSSVKGALRHRTLYHLRRESGFGSHRDPEAALAGLFGRTKSRAGEKATPGEERAGRIHIDDIVIDPKAWQQSGAFDHVSIDRYTGGAMPGLLYSEATLFGTKVPLRVEIAPERLEAADAEAAADDDAALRRALAWAMADLCAGRLPLGAKANAGHGTFLAKNTGEVEVALRALLRGGKEEAR